MIIANIGKVLRQAKETRAKIKNLASKANKVKANINKIATDSVTYCDTLLAQP